MNKNSVKSGSLPSVKSSNNNNGDEKRRIYNQINKPSSNITDGNSIILNDNHDKPYTEQNINYDDNDGDDDNDDDDDEDDDNDDDRDDDNDDDDDEDDDYNNEDYEYVSNIDHDISNNKNSKSITVKTKLYYCSVCNASFTFETNKCRHQKKCMKNKNDKCQNPSSIDNKKIVTEKKVIANEISITKSVIEEFIRDQHEANNKSQELMIMIYNELARLNTTSNNLTIQYMQLTNFGRESLWAIDKNKLLNCLQYGDEYAFELTKIMHLNPEMPQYHNIYIEDLTGNVAYVYSQNKWNICSLCTILQKLWLNRKININQLLNDDEYSKLLSLRQYVDLKKIETYDINHLCVKKFFNNVKNLFHSCREIILKTSERFRDLKLALPMTSKSCHPFLQIKNEHG
jgi:hypothetical protein